MSPLVSYRFILESKFLFAVCIQIGGTKFVVAGQRFGGNDVYHHFLSSGSTMAPSNPRAMAITIDVWFKNLRSGKPKEIFESPEALIFNPARMLSSGCSAL
jgi:hypothetical protein